MTDKPKTEDEPKRLMTFGDGMHPGLLDFLKYCGMTEHCGNFQIIGNAGQPLVVAITTNVEAFANTSSAKH